jgi:hypothetical protein
VQERERAKSGPYCERNRVGVANGQMRPAKGNQRVVCLSE